MPHSLCRKQCPQGLPAGSEATAGAFALLLLTLGARGGPHRRSWGAARADKVRWDQSGAERPVVALCAIHKGKHAGDRCLAATMEKDRMTRWISWVAVSSKPQHERESPKAQRRDNLAIVEKLGGTLVAELEVPGESRSLPSFEVAEREIEAYAALRQLLNQHAADAIVFLDVSRLGRTAPLAMSVMHECLTAGVALYDRSSPPPTLSAEAQRTDEAQLVMNSIRAGYAAAEVPRRTQRHRTDMPGKIPFGYRRVHMEDGTVEIAVDPEQAQIVRYAFEATLAGKPHAGIARDLNQAGVPMPHGGAGWTRRTIRDILRCGRTYAGYVTDNDQALGTTYHEGRHEAIITLSMAQETERELAESVGTRGRHAVLFSRVLVCDRCGSTLVAGKRRMEANPRVHDRTWHCGRGVRNATGDDGPSSCRGSEIPDQLAMDALNAFLKWAMNGVNLRDLIENVAMESVDQLRKVDELEVDILGLDQERERLIYMGQKGILSIDEVGERIGAIDRQLATLRAVVRDIAANLPHETLESRRERLYQFMRKADDLMDRMPADEANALLRRTLRMYVRDNQVIRIEAI